MFYFILYPFYSLSLYYILKNMSLHKCKFEVLTFHMGDFYEGFVKYV